jgi:hypothetical protein
MDAFDVWGENGDTANAAQPAPTTTAGSRVKWEEDLVPRGGGAVMGHAIFRGTLDGSEVKCKGWVEIDGDGGGSLVLHGRLTLVGNNIGEGTLNVIAASSQSSWNQVEVSIENPKRYKTV